MPKLLQINVTANWGSTGKIAEQIGLLAQEHGWTSYIAYGRYMNTSKNKLIKIGTIIDVYEHYFENILFDNEGRASRCSTSKFINEIEKIKPDLVHLHNIHDHYLNYELLFRYIRDKKIPVVWTQHDQWAITGHCCYSWDECKRWKTECYNCPLTKWYSLDQSKRNYHLKKEVIAKLPSLNIVPVSEWMAKIIKHSHLGGRPMKVIHNGIDLSVFKPQIGDICSRYGIPKNRKIILGVAAVWDERKGLSDFFKLAEILPAEDYVIVVVGKVISKYKDIANNHIYFIDRTQNAAELAQLYSVANVFVNPTYQDNYPTTNLEAIACGTPVITYRTGGSPEAIDEKTGVVIEPGDLKKLAESIQQLTSMDRGKLLFECRKRAEEFFDKNKCYKAYIELYNSIIN